MTGLYDVLQENIFQAIARGKKPKQKPLTFDAPPKLQLVFQHNGRHTHRRKKVLCSLQNELRDFFRRLISRIQ